MQLTEQLDLRGGIPCWSAAADDVRSDPCPTKVEIAIVGAGIVGAMIAQELARAGYEVCLLDRRTPAHGATAGSTALVMWGADVPLTHLARMIGADEAGLCWRRVLTAVQTLDARIRAIDISCGWHSRPELYLAGSVLDAELLQNEGKVRRASGLPSAFMSASEVSARFGVIGRPALLSEGSYEVDPVALTLGLIKDARNRGAALCFPFEVSRLAREEDAVRVHLSNGHTLIAGRVVLASGYDAARLFLPPHFALSSSYAIASAPDQAPAWGENALIWEASKPYLYARATGDGRLIFGGEDEDFVDPTRRDALIGAKGASLEIKAARLTGRSDIAFDCAWAATFGGSPDGLPAIGPARNMDNVILAYGYGGNGVTFASLAAGIVGSIVERRAQTANMAFDPYRDV